MHELAKAGAGKHARGSQHPASPQARMIFGGHQLPIVLRAWRCPVQLQGLDDVVVLGNEATRDGVRDELEAHERTRPATAARGNTQHTSDVNYSQSCTAHPRQRIHTIHTLRMTHNHNHNHTGMTRVTGL